MPLLLAPAALAGHYSDPVYSGGIATSGDFSTTDYTNGAGSASSQSFWLEPLNCGPADCSGKITATFEWVTDYPGEPPPQQVVVHKTATAIYGDGDDAEDPMVARGKADDGFGDPEVPVYIWYGPFVYNESSGERYSVQDGKAEVTVDCSPQATADANSDNADSWSCSVSCSISITPVSVQLDGTTLDDSHQDNILVGQHCTASMSAGPATLSNFQWSVPGETFADYRVLDYSYDWDPAAEIYIFTPGSGTVYNVDPSEYSKPNPQWYWKKGSLYGEEKTVSCTASASVNGQSIGSVTAEKKVSVWKPYYVFSPNALGVEMNNGGFNDSLLHADIQYTVGVGTPALFASSEGSGIWQTTQLCHINRLIEYFYGITVPNTTNGLVLDANFNYTSTSNPPGPFSANSTEDQPETQLISDSPSTDLDDCIRGTMDDQFKTYLMYLPPGNPDSVRWVPLNLCEWYVRADASRTFDVFHDIWSNWTPDPPGTMAITSNTDTSNHPQWIDVYD